MSAQLQFYVNNQIITRTDDFRPVTDSVNYLRAKFNFVTDEWTGLTKTAIFKGSDNVPYEVILDTDNECDVPWEVLKTEDGYITVSVFAGDLITANKVKVFVAASGYDPNAESSQPPTPSVYEQILDKLQNIDGGLFTDWND